MLELEKEAELLSLRLNGALTLGRKEGLKEGDIKWIRILRTKTSMSQQEIAQIAEVPESFVSKVLMETV